MLFFWFKPLFLVVIAAALVRTGMHAEHLLGEGIPPWTTTGVEEVGTKLRADIDVLAAFFN